MDYALGDVATCPHCKNRNILKYRGSHRRYFVNIIELKDWTSDFRFADFEPYVIEKGITSRKDRTFYYITYVACDECVRPDHVSTFHYYPNGWKLKMFKTKDKGPYEDI